MGEYKQCQKCFIKIDETDTLAFVESIQLFVCKRCLSNLQLENV